MQANNSLRDKKVAIVGFSRSGLSAAKLLSSLYAQIWISDNSNNMNIQHNLEKLSPSRNIRIETGRHTEEFIKGSEFVVVSPGVNQDAAPIKWALKYNIKIISEIELGFLFCPAKIIAVTGTNGKTTVVILITKIFQQGGYKAFTLGNIGSPFCERVLSLDVSDFVVLEVSTFQLEWINKFKPKVSVILNISRNHLDRHKDMEEYIELKKRIFLNQTRDDFTVLNNNDSIVKEFARQTKAKVVYFTDNDGSLNSNQMAAMAVASIFNINKDISLDVFKNFKGIEHRLEYVDTINGVDFINDSKSTTVDATIWALKNIKKPVILIAGGMDKGGDFKQLRSYASNNIKNIILIGEAKNLIRSALEDMALIKNANSLEEAAGNAFSLASQGDCVLLSPMCASFDMFTNFEERGKVFKDIVSKIKFSKN